MKILIDLQAAQSVSRLHGIGRYSLSLTKAIAKKAGNHQVFLALNACFPESIEFLRFTFKDLIPDEQIKVFHTNQPTAEHLNNRANIKLSKKLREHFLNSLSPDIVHITSLFEGWVDGAVTSIGELDNNPPTTVTLYDLIPFLQSKIYLKDTAINRFYHRKLQNLKRADLLLAISASSQQEAIDQLCIPPERIVNCSAGLSTLFKSQLISDREREALKKTFSINRKFILYVGGFDQRKNISGLMKAYAALPPALRKQHQLVIVGRLIDSAIQYAELLRKRFKLHEEELILTNYVPDKQLVTLYNACNLFVLPSFHEGFGLPLLEAMACGAVSIASNISSLSSLINCQEALFDPNNDRSITRKMAESLTNESLRHFLSAHGKEQAKNFNWDTCAQKALAAFEALNKNKKGDIILTKASYTKNKMAFISPLPPAKTGIAGYSTELLPELACFYDIVLIVDHTITLCNRWIDANFSIRDSQWFIQHASQFDIILYQFGNSPLHYYMFRLFELYPGIVVLHDFSLSGVQHWIDSTIPEQKYSFDRVLYHSHGLSALHYHKTKGRQATLEKYPCNFTILKRAMGTIVHSDYTLKLAKEWYRITSPQILRKIKPLNRKLLVIDRAEARKKLKLKDKDFLICSFGFISPHKLSQRICLSLPRSALFSEGKCLLIFVGENHLGDYGNKLKVLIKEANLKNKVTITGFLSAEDFDSYLMAADLAIQLRRASQGETSACLINCLSAGIPTIINDYGSFREFPKNVVFRLSEHFTNSALSAAIDYLYRNPLKRKQLSQNALDYVKQLHPAYIAKLYKQLIDYFIQHNPNYQERHLLNNLAQDNFDDLDIKTSFITASTIAANKPPIGLNQLLVDISVLVHTDEKTGIQRVVRGILNSLVQYPPPRFRVEVIYYNRNEQYCYARKFAAKMLELPEDLLEDNVVEIKTGDIFLGLDFCPTSIPYSKSILEEWRLRGIQIYFVLYDMLPLNPRFFPDSSKTTFHSWLKTVTLVGNGVLCISNQVAQEFSNWLKKEYIDPPQLNIGVFYLGSDLEATFPTFGLPPNELLKKTSTHLSFLCVGRIEPRKGHFQIIEAFNQLWVNGMNVHLILVGRKGWEAEKLTDAILQHSEYGKRLIWLQEASDETLTALYQSSSALILASENEGFGLPLIEAAYYGLDIIVRDIPIFREIAEDHAFYFKGNKAADLAVAIEEWTKLKKNGRLPSLHGIRFFSWKESTQQLLNIFLKDGWIKQETKNQPSTRVDLLLETSNV